MNHNVARIIYLFAILMALVSAACAGSVPPDRSRRSPAGSAGVEEAVAAPVTVNVTAREFEFVLDRSSAAPGAVTFIVQNTGHMPHDFAIRGPGVDAKTPMLDPGETAELEVTLETGAYDYICTVPGHVVLGMTGEFTVTP